MSWMLGVCQHPPVVGMPASSDLPSQVLIQSKQLRRERQSHIHSPGASGDPTTLLHAFELAPARVLGLALHVVVIVGPASRTNKEGGREKGRGAGTNLLDLGDRVGERGGVVKDLLVEAAKGSADGRHSDGIGPIGPPNSARVFGEYIHRLPSCHVDCVGRPGLRCEAVRGLELVILQPVRFGFLTCGSHPALTDWLGIEGRSGQVRRRAGDQLTADRIFSPKSWRQLQQHSNQGQQQIANRTTVFFLLPGPGSTTKRTLHGTIRATTRRLPTTIPFQTYSAIPVADCLLTPPPNISPSTHHLHSTPRHHVLVTQPACRPVGLWRWRI